MGYLTKFSGWFDIEPILGSHHCNYLRKFSGIRHVKRNVDVLMRDNPNDLCIKLGLGYGVEGSYFIGGMGSFVSIVDWNSCPDGLPGLWCDWVPNKVGSRLMWSGQEKFYNYVEWLQYLLDNFFIRWGYNLDGVVGWVGRGGDEGNIVVEDNKIFVISLV